MRTLIGLVIFIATTSISSACPLAEAETAAVAKASPVVQSPGKRTAAIGVDYRLQRKPAVGQPLQLEIALVAPGKAPLLVDINTPAALGLPAGRLQREVASGDMLSLDLTPQAAGRFYVNVIARAAADGLARVVSIPVQVGVSDKSVSKAETTPDGELIVRLPAAE